MAIFTNKEKHRLEKRVKEAEMDCAAANEALKICNEILITVKAKLVMALDENGKLRAELARQREVSM
jgi:hypothetical protein